VLVIDDNDHEREIFSSFLRFVGGTVLKARDGAEGLRIVQEHLPDRSSWTSPCPYWTAGRRSAGSRRTRWP
jgi:hypothetical protein